MIIKLWRAVFGDCDLLPPPGRDQRAVHENHFPKFGHFSTRKVSNG